jgi:hypothetical protein
MNDVITLTTQKVSPGKNKCQHILPGIDETNIHILNAKTGKHSIKVSFDKPIIITASIGKSFY